MRAVVVGWLSACALLWVGACAESDYGEEGTAPVGTTDAAAAETASIDRADASFSDGAPPCPTGDGPDMVVVELTNTKNLCIDRTEVTTAQYAAFHGRIEKAPELLEPLRRLAPPPCDQLLVAGLSTPQTPSDLPQNQVSFCSAIYFCAASGKRMCGALFDGSAVVVKGQDTEAPSLEWEAACARGAASTGYPWGSNPSAPEALGCNTRYEDGGPAALRSASGSTCGRDGGPVDMLGNLWEFVNVRQDRETTSFTSVRGGALNGPLASCVTRHAVDANLGMYEGEDPLIGIRCCADVHL